MMLKLLPPYYTVLSTTHPFPLLHYSRHNCTLNPSYTSVDRKPILTSPDLSHRSSMQTPNLIKIELSEGNSKEELADSWRTLSNIMLGHALFLEKKGKVLSVKLSWLARYVLQLAGIYILIPTEKNSTIITFSFLFISKHIEVLNSPRNQNTIWSLSRTSISTSIYTRVCESEFPVHL